MKNNSKNIFLFSFLLLISFGFYSCKKDVAEDDRMDFKFTGSTDTTIGVGENFSRSLKVLYLGGAFERVTFSTANVPAGVEISYEPATALVDSTVSQIIKVSSTADTGHFNVIVTGTAAQGKTFVKEFDLHIIPAFNFKPVILLVFGAGIDRPLNTPFVDPGFSASDAEDGDLTSQVRTYGNVNSDSAGIYTLSYAVTDANGQVDSVIRKVGIRNDLYLVNGSYTCTTTNLQTNQTIGWTTSISTSNSINNQGTIFKFSSLYPAPAIFNYDPVKDSIFIPSQTFTGQTPDNFTHTFEGSGKLYRNGANVHFVIDYTDSYFDTIAGMQMTVNKRDDYTN